MHFDVIKSSRSYTGEPYSGPSSDYIPLRFKTYNDALLGLGLIMVFTKNDRWRIHGYFDQWDLYNLSAAFDCVSDLIEDSSGVDGLHLNGDIAYWQELISGCSDEWLFDFAAVYEKFMGKPL